jgi:hypothetical protein
MDEAYLTKLQNFVKLIKEHQNTDKWTFELGRKYDKVQLYDVEDVRYFVERSTGTIYGARSNTTPHLGWYFGSLDRCHLWDWSGFHGVPTNDPDIRPFKTYGPFVHYRLV